MGSNLSMVYAKKKKEAILGESPVTQCNVKGKRGKTRHLLGGEKRGNKEKPP